MCSNQGLSLEMSNNYLKKIMKDTKKYTSINLSTFADSSWSKKVKLHCSFNIWITGTGGSMIDKLAKEEVFAVELHNFPNISIAGTDGSILNKLDNNHSGRRHWKTSYKPWDIPQTDIALVFYWDLDISLLKVISTRQK